MNKKVLILLGEYYPNPSANGICINQIVKSLKVNNYDVDIASNYQIKTEKVDGLYFYKIPFYNRFKSLPSKFNCKILKLFFKIIVKGVSVIRNIFVKRIPLYFDKKYYNNMLNLVKKLYKRNQYDIIFAVSYPYESLLVAKKLKEDYHNIKYIPYILDANFNLTLEKQRLLLDFEDFKKSFEEVLDGAEIVISQKEHRILYEKYFSKYVGKIRYVGVPLLENKTSIRHNKNKKIRVLYAGSIYTTIRNPEYIFNVFSLLKNIELIMYVPDADFWRKKVSNFKNIKIFEKVSYEKICEIQKNVDAFLNIGNSLVTASPSKLVEYMCYGRPIISTYRINEDSSKAILKNYPLGLAIDERAVSYQDSAEDIEKLLNCNSCSIPFENYSHYYENNKPEYVVKIIEEIL